MYKSVRIALMIACLTSALFSQVSGAPGVTGGAGGAVTGAGTAGQPAMYTGPAIIGSSPMYWDASQFPGSDNCAKTLAATSTPVNSNNSTVTFMWPFVSSSYTCAAAPVSPTLVETLFVGPGQMQMNGFSVVAGGQTEIEGTSLGYAANGGTVLQMQTSGFLPGTAANYGAGSYASPPAYAAGTTYNRGLAVSSVGINYVSVFPGNQSAHTPASSPTQWSLISSEPSPIMGVYQKGVGGGDVEATMFHRMSAFCQYTGGTNTATDGCVGYMNLWGQELTRTDRLKIKNPTITGFWLDGQTVADSGPYTDMIISWDNPNAVASQAASKVNGSDASTQQAAISTITVAGNIATVLLTSTPAFTVWRGELLDILNGAASYSNLLGSDIGETANTHGLWQVYSVQDATHFIVFVPSGMASCASSCGTALFYPTGITVSSPNSTTGANRGIDGVTINCSNCTSGVNYSNYPPLAIAMNGGTYPLSNIHTEGFRVGVCVGCFGVSNGEVIRNAFLTTNTHTSILISANYGSTGVTNLDLFNVGSTNVAGSPLTLDTIVDKINGNVITTTNNPIVHHYWLDASGVAYLEAGNCADMTKGWCQNAGSLNQYWCYYVAAVKVFCTGSPTAVTFQKNETTTADATFLVFTPPATAGNYRVCYGASVSAATAGVIGFTLSWTDSNGNAQANIALPLFQAGTAAPALTFTTSAISNYNACYNVDTNAGAAAITLKWVGGGVTTAKATGSLERLQ